MFKCSYKNQEVKPTIIFWFNAKNNIHRVISALTYCMNPRWHKSCTYYNEIENMSTVILGNMLTVILRNMLTVLYWEIC